MDKIRANREDRGKALKTVWTVLNIPTKNKKEVYTCTRQNFVYFRILYVIKGSSYNYV